MLCNKTTAFQRAWLSPAANLPPDQQTAFVAFHRLVESTCQFEYLDVRKCALTWPFACALLLLNRRKRFLQAWHQPCLSRMPLITAHVPKHATMEHQMAGCTL